MKENRYADVDAIQKASANMLKLIDKNNFKNSFDMLILIMENIASMRKETILNKFA